MSTPKFKVGEVVRWTNSNGVDLGARRVVLIENITYSDSGFGYILDPTDTPWFAVKEEELR
jgi:hypothetical protein